MIRPVSLIVLLVATLLAPSSHAQSAAPQAQIVLTKLGSIAYPQIARVAHISGDVEIELGIKPDGSQQFARVLSGPPLLTRAALESAQQSQFDCRNCTEAVTSYKLLYTFRLIDGEIGNCSPGAVTPSSYPRNQTFPIINDAGNHVTIVDREQPCYADAIRTQKVRSWKCLYLWRCSRQWF